MSDPQKLWWKIEKRGVGGRVLLKNFRTYLLHFMIKKERANRKWRQGYNFMKQRNKVYHANIKKLIFIQKRFFTYTWKTQHHKYVVNVQFNFFNKIYTFNMYGYYNKLKLNCKVNLFLIWINTRNELNLK